MMLYFIHWECSLPHSTPRKMNMEPENAPLKCPENHLNQTIILPGSISIFGGVQNHHFIGNLHQMIPLGISKVVLWVLSSNIHGIFYDVQFSPQALLVCGPKVKAPDKDPTAARLPQLKRVKHPWMVVMVRCLPGYTIRFPISSMYGIFICLHLVDFHGK